MWQMNWSTWWIHHHSSQQTRGIRNAIEFKKSCHSRIKSSKPNLSMNHHWPWHRSITPAVVMSQKWNKDNHLDHHYMLSKNLVVDLGIYHGFIPIKDEQVKNPRGLKINYMASMRNQAPRPWGFDSSGYGLCCSNKQLEKRLRLNVTLTKRMTEKRDSSKVFILLYLPDY